MLQSTSDAGYMISIIPDRINKTENSNGFTDIIFLNFSKVKKVPVIFNFLMSH